MSATWGRPPTFLCRFDFLWTWRYLLRKEERKIFRNELRSAIWNRLSLFGFSGHFSVAAAGTLFLFYNCMGHFFWKRLDGNPRGSPIFLDLDARRQNAITFERWRVVWIPAGIFESTYRFRTYVISRNVPRTCGGRLKRIPTCIVLKLRKIERIL